MLSDEALAQQKQETREKRRQEKAEPSLRKLLGLECLPLLQDHLHRLHHAYQHPNRTLHYDAVLITLLLGFFNATDNSLRMLDDLSCSEDAAAALDGQRSARSTLSDAMAAMDAKLLMPIIKDLHRRLPAPVLQHQDADLHALLKTIIAADGSVFTVPADVLWGIAVSRSNGKPGRQVRLNMQLDALQFVPAAFSFSGREEGNEADAFAKQLLENVIYLADRNFVDFDFIAAVLAKHSDLVVRLRKDTGFFPQQMREPTAQDRQAGVLRDSTGHLSAHFGKDHLFREVVVWDERNKKEVRLLTTLLEVPAAVIGKLYRHRWMVELFFKWLKCTAKLRHLISHSHNGITIQLYVAVIMVLLTYLRTGQKPGVYECNCLAWVAAGMMSVQVMQQVLARRQRERDLAKARLARKRAAQQPV